jgi:hypothetical protein
MLNVNLPLESRLGHAWRSKNASIEGRISRFENVRRSGFTVVRKRSGCLWSRIAGGPNIGGSENIRRAGCWDTRVSGGQDL